MGMIMKITLAKKNCKKGFTLVEVIVVLVILAILAAIAIPALTGYIDKANNRALITQARTVAVALQTIVSEEYGDGYVIDSSYESSAFPTDESFAHTMGDVYSEYSKVDDNWFEAVNRLTGSNFTYMDDTGDGDLRTITITGTKVVGFTLQKGNTLVTYDNGEYEVETITP
jgi:prepilin-type N-terminal cleavage/methylation domain-containing protein